MCDMPKYPYRINGKMRHRKKTKDSYITAENGNRKFEQRKTGQRISSSYMYSVVALLVLKFHIIYYLLSTYSHNFTVHTCKLYLTIPIQIQILIQGILRHQTPPRSRNAARGAILRDVESLHAHAAHYNQTWRHP